MQAREDLVDFLGLEGLGIEPAAAPLEEFVMANMPWIGNRGKEIRIAPRAPDILWGAGPTTGHACWANAPSSREAVRNDHAVFPSIAEVVPEVEFITGARDIAESDGCGVNGGFGPVVGILDIRGIADAEGIEVAALPAHSREEYLLHFREGVLTWDQDAAPHLRTHVPQGDLQLIHRSHTGIVSPLRRVGSSSARALIG